LPAGIVVFFIADHVVAAVFTPMVLSLVRITREELDGPTKNLSKLLLFSVAYGASIGGLYATSGGVDPKTFVLWFASNSYKSEGTILGCLWLAEPVEGNIEKLRISFFEKDIEKVWRG
jgi:di/tricarboxylate transporter